jgi:hypothetical protein
MASTGPSGLPSAGPSGPTVAQVQAVVEDCRDVVDERFWRFLVDSGFPPARALTALVLARMNGKNALEWLMRNVDREEANDVLLSPAQVRASLLRRELGGPAGGEDDPLTCLVAMGFDVRSAAEALSRAGNNLAVATELLLRERGGGNEAPPSSSSSSSSSASASTASSSPPPPASDQPSISTAEMERTREIVASLQALPSVHSAMSNPTLRSALEFIVENSTNPAITRLLMDPSVARVLADIQQVLEREMLP